MKTWILDEGFICKMDPQDPYEPETIVRILNEYEDKIEKQERIIQDYETFSDNDYWKGMETTYQKIISEYMDRIIALELEKWYYEVENEELREQLKK